ncbi:type II toxin-antitoxin system RelE/ParE family toxin [Pseudomonas sp. MYb185]|uniref:type II toxin-antitoxin system RelE/ParE family toxin n=1 Tax=Pseudomonas sp. MYb185 TaxID=1848729 RepID=UPI000CFC7054|nr:type II toxin-antitoxin system RelE/ParE family toxin [Pseudomonas sp. MYb185]PRB82693.1 plasmid stabilization protein [Pseudomonas sp. MYb185]
MAFGFRLTRDAQQDLKAIRRYTVNTWGQEQSRKYLQGAREAMELLAEFPGQGLVRLDVGEGVFSFPYGSHMLYYRLEKKQLVIFAMLHQRMVPTEHLQGR